MSETNKKIGIENFYATTITKPGGISSYGDLAFTVSVPPQYPRGFLIVDPNDANKRERMYYHDVIGNTVYVRFANRANPQAHSQGAPVQMNDMAEIFNFIQSCTSSTGYIEKGNGLDIIVWGGPLVINADNSVTSALDTTLTLTDGTINYVYFDFDDSEYKSTTSELAIVGLEIARVTCAGGFVAGIENIYSRLGRDGSTGQPGPQGAPGNGIESITLISTVGIDKTYRITFTDSTTFDYSVADGINGADGTDGNGIASVALISTMGNVKTYRITFTDSTTFDFVVTDGANGTDGIDGTDGTDGRGIASIIRTSGTGAPGTTDTYTITYTDATTSTFTVYNGANGTGSIVSVSGSMVDNTDPNNPVVLSDTTKVSKSGDTMSGELIIQDIAIRKNAIATTDSGAFTGCVLTWTVGTTSASLSLGESIHINKTAKTAATITRASDTAITDAYPSAGFTHILLDYGGNIIQQTTSITGAQESAGILYCGVLAKQSGVISYGASLVKRYDNSKGAQTIMNFFGSVQDGDILLSGNAGLTLAYSSGSVLRANAGDADNPDTPTLNSKNPASMTFYWRNGSGGFNNGNKVTTFSTGLYDDGSGTLASFTSKYGIYYFGLSTNGELLVAYPQATYVTLAAAQAAITGRTYNPILSPQFKKIVKFAKVIAIGTATDLSNTSQCDIQNLGMTLGWNSGGGGSSGSGGDFFGPASSTTNNLISFADTTGKVGKDSGILSTKVVTTDASQSLSNKQIAALLLDGASPKYNTTQNLNTGGTTVLVAGDNGQILNPATGTNTAQLPVASTMQVGQYFIFDNTASGNTNPLTINSSGGNLVYSLPSGENIRVVLIKNTGTDASSWRVETQLVPTSRTITINGTTYDLSADRSWTISGGGGTPDYLLLNYGIL